jgi:drug/metabolite transporter (DMT)-like permease
LYFRILAAAGATNLLLVTFLIPVVAVLLGGLLLDEHLGTRQAGGMLLIALALVLANGRSLRVGPAAK